MIERLLIKHKPISYIVQLYNKFINNFFHIISTIVSPIFDAF